MILVTLLFLIGVISFFARCVHIVPDGYVGIVRQRYTGAFRRFVPVGWYLLSPLDKVVEKVAIEQATGQLTTAVMLNGHEIDVEWSAVYGFEPKNVTADFRPIVARRLGAGDGVFIVQSRLNNAIHHYIQQATNETLFATNGQAKVEELVKQVAQQQLAQFGLVLFRFQIEPLEMPYELRRLLETQDRLSIHAFNRTQQLQIEAKLREMTAVMETKIEGMWHQLEVERERRHQLNQVEFETRRREIAQHLSSADVEKSLKLSLGEMLEKHGLPPSTLGHPYLHAWLATALSNNEQFNQITIFPNNLRSEYPHIHG